MSKFFISITTFQKSDALKVLLDSLIALGYADQAVIHIADDNAGKKYEVLRETNPSHPIWKTKTGQQFDSMTLDSAADVYEEYRAKISELHISYGPERGGIGINKNRGISYFLQKTKLEYCLLLDDDIVFRLPGMLEEWADVLKANTGEVMGQKFTLNHLTGYWTDFDPDYIDPLKGQAWSVSKAGWFNDFPMVYLGDRVEWRGGAMGCSNFYSRKCLDEIMFYDIFTKYGYEHTVHSARAMLKVDKRSPVLYPIYDYCSKYFIGQSIANNYSDAAEEAQKADIMYQERMGYVCAGEKLLIKDPGFDPKLEKVY